MSTAYQDHNHRNRGVTALSTTQSTLFIGCNPTNKNCFNGEFAEFRVWKVPQRDGHPGQLQEADDGQRKRLGRLLEIRRCLYGNHAADSVTTNGHTAHPGTLKATTPAQNPTFVAPTSAVPLTCRKLPQRNQRSRARRTPLPRRPARPDRQRSHQAGAVDGHRAHAVAHAVSGSALMKGRVTRGSA